MTRTPSLGCLTAASLLLLCSSGAVAQPSCTLNPYYSIIWTPQQWDVGDGSTEQTTIPEICRVPGRRLVLSNGNYTGNDTSNDLGLSSLWYDEADEYFASQGTDLGLDTTDPAAAGYFEDFYSYTSLNNPSGSDNGIADRVDDLINQLNALYAGGWRRVMIVLPAGYYEGDDMASSQYWGIAPTKRAGLELTTAGGLAHWISTHTDVRVEVYGGWFLDDPNDVCSVTMDYQYDPDPTDNADMKTVWQNVHPWFHKIGVHRYWFDAASGHADTDPGEDTQFRRSDFAQICALGHFADDDYYLGGEAIPLTLDGSTRVVDEDYIDVAPWLAIHRYVDETYSSVFANVTFDPELTEISMLLSGHSTPDPDYVDAVNYVRKGYVLWANDASYDDDIKGAYGMRWFPGYTDPAPFDLDGDGNVDMDDLAAAIDAYNAGADDGAGSDPIGSGGWVTKAHGDVHGGGSTGVGDGDVDIDDLLAIAAHYD